MENNTEKKIIDEDLANVAGGTGIFGGVPAGWTSTTVEDDGHGCVKCPHDGTVLDYPRCAVPDDYWCDDIYHCKRCRKWVVKTLIGQWYESDSAPEGVIFF